MNDIRRGGLKFFSKPPETGDSGLKAVFIFGPTAVGKSDLLLSMSDSLPGMEIISSDSMQVYRGMDIGSAKPAVGDRRRIPHHLIDIRNPDQDFNLADFVNEAELAIREVRSRGGIPVVSGGTAFYFKHLWFGLPQSPPAVPAIREQLRRELCCKGLKFLRDELGRVDPLSHCRISANDEYRVLRALEVYRSSGRPLSDFSVPNQPRQDFQALVIGLERGRSELYGRIDARVELMFEMGLEGEFRGLLSAGYGSDSPGMKGIGYREFLLPDRMAALLSTRGLGAEEKKQIISEIQKSSRRYAKRQLTFFRSLPGTIWLNPDLKQLIIKKIAEFFSAPTA